MAVTPKGHDAESCHQRVGRIVSRDPITSVSRSAQVRSLYRIRGHSSVSRPTGSLWRLSFVPHSSEPHRCRFPRRTELGTGLTRLRAVRIAHGDPGIGAASATRVTSASRAAFDALVAERRLGESGIGRPLPARGWHVAGGAMSPHPGAWRDPPTSLKPAWSYQQEVEDEHA
jgi:hypothetical protein